VAEWRDEGAAEEMARVQGIVTTIRTLRAESNVKPSERLKAVIEGAGEGLRHAFERQDEYIRLLAGLESLGFEDVVSRDQGTVTRVFEGVRVHVRLPAFDVKAEIEKVRRQLDGKLKEIEALERKLSNDSFVERAPGTVVAEARERRHSLGMQRDGLEATLRELEDDRR
jgi:valyl-tRNA synthetase